MKKLLFSAVLLSLVLVFPAPTTARVNVGVSISLPPLIVSSGPLELVVIPETYVYAAPDLDDDIYFYNGWWWRPWQGRWYRSRNYNSRWTYYSGVPSFQRSIPSHWRHDYRDRQWKGRTWEHQRIPHQQVQRNWRTWEKKRHWERQNTWGVQGMRPQTRSLHPAQPVKRHVQKAAKPQQRKAPQKSQARQGTHDRGENERQGRR
ncbi:MAG: hypothetical protein JW943_17505 [Deltaproteobacteria bacterium]|nr:hypothetical protein [Deltaproteobacteria bacterium]